MVDNINPFGSGPFGEGPFGPTPGDFTLVADAGAFSLSGQTATSAFTGIAGAGAFLLTGQVATPIYLTAALAGNAGTFVLTGQPAASFFARPADTGAFLLSGQTAFQGAPPSLGADTGAFVFTGKDTIEAIVAGGRIVRGQFSKGQWRNYKSGKRREYDKRKYAYDRKTGFKRKRYEEQIEAGDAAFHDFILGLEAGQTQRAFDAAQLFARQLAAQQDALGKFHSKANMAYLVAQQKQFARDAAEEEEALELLMMEDE